jgi:hypothetical protein
VILNVINIFLVDEKNSGLFKMLPFKYIYLKYIIYIHVSKCKNDKIKERRKKIYTVYETNYKLLKRGEDRGEEGKEKRMIESEQYQNTLCLYKQRT